MADALAQQNHATAKQNDVDAEAAAWARGRSSHRAIVDLYAEMLALKAIIKALETKLDGHD